MKNNKMLAFAAATVLTATLTACASAPPPQLVIHPDMNDAAVFAVDGLKNRYWGKRLTFGPYHTEKTRVGETWRWSAGLFGPQFGAQHQPYRFEFVDDAGDRYQVECRAKTPILRHATRSSEWTIPLGETRLSCGIKDPAGNVASIVLHGIAGDFSGETGFAGLDDFEIAALRSFAGADGGRTFSLPSALGYELRQGGKVVATVDTFGRPLVYLAKELEPKQRTAAAITLTVLMFFEEA